MKHPFRFYFLPCFTVITGTAGFRLCAWLFSAADEKGLLPAQHPAATILFSLTALVLGVLFLVSRKLSAQQVCPKRLRAFRFFAAFCYVLGGLGLITTGLAGYTDSTVKLALVATWASFAGGVLLILMAFLKLIGRKLPYLLPALLTVVLMLEAVAQCQVWGTEPQLEIYFFPLMASVLLILSAYQKTALTAGKGKPALLAFFSQGAAFFCFVSLASYQWPLYLGLLFWTVVQLYPCIYCIYPSKEA